MDLTPLRQALAQLDDALRFWREMRNATSHTYDQARAETVAQAVAGFVPEARRLLQAMERGLG